MIHSNPLHSSGLVLAIGAIIALALWAPPCACYGANLEDCVAMPRPPLHGSLKYAGGSLLARLVCPKGTDLAVTAPGYGGLMSCTPHSEEETDNFDEFKVPTCLPYKKPEGLTMPFTASFTTNACPKSNSITKSLARKVIVQLNKIVPYKCSPKVSCTWKLDYADCAENFNFEKEGHSHQIDFVMDLRTTEYDPKIPIDRYLNLSDKIINEDIKKSDLSLPGFTFQGIMTNDAWIASCGNHPRTTGSELDKHMISSCRGCPVNFVMTEMSAECWQCPGMTYTHNKPFAETCDPCPDKDKWKDQKSFQKNCIDRV